MMSMENYTAYYSRTGKAGKTDWNYQNYSFFASDDNQADKIAGDFAWRSNHSTWSGPTISLEKITKLDNGEVIFERQ